MPFKFIKSFLFLFLVNTAFSQTIKVPLNATSLTAQDEKVLALSKKLDREKTYLLTIMQDGHMAGVCTLFKSNSSILKEACDHNAINIIKLDKKHKSPVLSATLMPSFIYGANHYSKNDFIRAYKYQKGALIELEADEVLIYNENKPDFLRILVYTYLIDL